MNRTLIYKHDHLRCRTEAITPEQAGEEIRRSGSGAWPWTWLAHVAGGQAVTVDGKTYAGSRSAAVDGARKAVRPIR